MPAKTKFIKLLKKDFGGNQLQLFLQYCSGKDNLNSHYPSFISLSHSLYRLLFQQLQIPKGRVVICPNNFLIPFEALCTDNTGKNFLVKDYAFSYVYSARYLLKKFPGHKTEGNFIGFAPVMFQPYLHLSDLEQSSVSLGKCADYYSNSALFLNVNASRSNFLQSISGYDIVNIFSHASADTTGNEPLLYMQDSIIRLSELQVLHNVATRLVVLSACETNVGKNATGEGIYSLARGFAAAGIPSIAATLWSAEDRSVYAITEKFHEYISKGIPEDQALQKAKLYFMQNGAVENEMPYYWANIIITGNAGPVILSPNLTIERDQLHLNPWWIGSGIIMLLLLASAIYYKKLKAG